MLSGLANYFFGSNETEDQLNDNETTQLDPQESNTTQLETTQLETRPTDDEDWILVEKSIHHPPGYLGEPRLSDSLSLPECRLPPSNTDSQSDSDTLMTDTSHPSVCHDDPHSDATDSDLWSVAERVVYPSMEESWLVTPPACFTAGLGAAGKMETSSMENLLIEHPSMSVYSHRGRLSSTGLDSNHSESSEEGVPQSDNAGLARHRHEPPRRPSALAARVGLTQVQAIKSMQKAQQRQQNRTILSRKYMTRSNLSRDKANKRYTRSRVTHQPATRLTSYNKQY